MKELWKHSIHGKPLEDGSIQVECDNNATLFAEGQFFMWSVCHEGIIDIITYNI